MDAARAMQIFLDIQRGLPRQGPGDDAATRRALACCVGLPDSPAVLDIGCGPGQQTLVLAEALAGPITAVDLHRGFLAELEERAEARGLRDRITPMSADMADLPFEPGSFDLVWSEGAAYVMGVANALQAWKPLLVPGGCLALSELVWLTDHPPQPAREFWAGEYPAMRDVARNCALFAEAGYELLGHFTLSDAAWWDDYYTPLKAKLPELRARYRDDEQALELVRMTEAEIAMREQYGSFYGYVFFVARAGERHRA